MRSNYDLYLEEVSPSRRVYEDDMGFFIYSVHKQEFYVEEVFVRKEFRKKGVAAEYDGIAISMAKSHGCTYIKGSVIPSANKATESLKFQLALGYELVYCDGMTIYLQKKIGE